MTFFLATYVDLLGKDVIQTIGQWCSLPRFNVLNLLSVFYPRTKFQDVRADNHDSTA